MISGNVVVDRRAIGEPHNVVIEDGSQWMALQRWAEAGQAGGAQLWLQLNHPGRQIPRTLSRRPVTPSAVPMKMPGKLFAPPRALEEAEGQGWESTHHSLNPAGVEEDVAAVG